MCWIYIFILYILFIYLYLFAFYWRPSSRNADTWPSTSGTANMESAPPTEHLIVTLILLSTPHFMCCRLSKPWLPKASPQLLYLWSLPFSRQLSLKFSVILDEWGWCHSTRKTEDVYCSKSRSAWEKCGWKVNIELFWVFLSHNFNLRFLHCSNWIQGEAV